MVPTRWQKMCVNKGLTVKRLAPVLLFLLLDCRETRKYREKSYVTKWCHKYLNLVYFQPFLVDLFTGIDFGA